MSKRMTKPKDAKRPGEPIPICWKCEHAITHKGDGPGLLFIGCKENGAVRDYAGAKKFCHLLPKNFDKPRRNKVLTPSLVKKKRAPLSKIKVFQYVGGGQNECDGPVIVRRRVHTKNLFGSHDGAIEDCVAYPLVWTKRRYVEYRGMKWEVTAASRDGWILYIPQEDEMVWHQREAKAAKRARRLAIKRRKKR